MGIMTDFDFDTDLLGDALPAGPRPAKAGVKARVLFPLPLPEPFDYWIPEDLEVRPGDHVSAPISGTLRRGIVWSVEPDDGSRELKTIESRLFAPPLPGKTREFIDRVARYCVQPPGQILRM